jgi:hypothetical protein
MKSKDRKDLILITCYTPDETRQRYLEELINSVNFDKFDVLLSTHSDVSKQALQKSTYMIYDSNNVLLHDFNHKFRFYFDNDDFSITTTEYREYNHIVAAGSLILNGLVYAKSLGYTKVHFLEYDSIFLDDGQEFLENSQLLENYSIVWYKHWHSNAETIFSMFSLHLDKIDKKWFDNSLEHYMNYVNRGNNKTLESFHKTLVDLSPNTYCKNRDELSNKIQYCRYDSNILNWVVPLKNSKNSDVILFTFNETGTNLEILIIVNDNSVHTINNSKLNIWSLKTIANYESLEKITLVYGQFTRVYDFSKIDKQKFFSINKIEYRNE